MRVRVLPYSMGSQSAFALSRALDGRVLHLEQGTYTYQRGDTIINWGNSKGLAKLDGAPILNVPELVKIASNKLKFFEMMREVNSTLIPEFWTDRADIPDEAFPIVCRTVLTGHSGAGIVIAENREQLVEAPLYVGYIKKKQEYRVHVGTGQIIAIQRKARRMDVPDDQINWQVRNLAGGFVYARQDVAPPPSVAIAATKALIVSGLDFGAVDVVYYENRAGSGAKVLELNTAPGLAGTTVDDYARYFRNKRGN